MTIDKPQGLPKDLAEAVAWFIKGKKRMAWRRGGDDIIVRPDGVFLLTPKDKSQKAT